MPLPQDIPACASLLELCCATKNLRNLLQLHGQSIKLGFSYNDFIRAKLVSAYASCAQMSEAHFIFSLSNRQSAFLYNTLIRGYASIKEFHLSLSCFHQMLLARKPIDLNTLPAVLKSVSGLSILRIGKRVHGSILVRGFGSDPAHCNALITMYGKSGDLRVAHKVFDKMPDRNRVTWSAMMGVYGMHNFPHEVIELFDRMLDSGIQPDGVTFTTLLTACSHGGLVDEGKVYFEMMMERFGLRPSMEHYTCVVDMLGRAGRIEEAKDIIEKMEMEPDEALWRALLGACRIHLKFEISVRGKLFRLVD